MWFFFFFFARRLYSWDFSEVMSLNLTWLCFINNIIQMTDKQKKLDSEERAPWSLQVTSNDATNDFKDKN